MEFIALIEGDWYPKFEEDRETQEISKSLLRHICTVARLTYLNLSRIWERKQPEGYCERINAHYYRESFLLYRTVSHARSTVALSKMIEGHVKILEIFYDISLHVTYLDNLPDWACSPAAVLLRQKC